MGKWAVRSFVQGRGGMVPARADAAPYPTDWKYSRKGIDSLFHWQANDREAIEEREKHTGGVGVGVDEITLSGPHRKMNLGGMDHIADGQGKLRLLDSGYWGRAVGEYEKRIEYLTEIARVAVMSNEICAQTLGAEFVAACAPGVQAYKGEPIPPSLAALDATPDLIRVLPRTGNDFLKAYSKIMWLLERTSVAFSGPVEEFAGTSKKHADEETGKRTLKEACT